MLGRKSYEKDEITAARTAVEQQLTAFRGFGDVPADTEATYFNGMLLALDRRFVHRLRGVTGKAGTPLNELEMLVEALMDHGGKLATHTVIRYDPAEAVLGTEVGDPVRLVADDFERLAAAVLDELEAKYR